jgi:hypothetical protein
LIRSVGILLIVAIIPIYIDCVCLCVCVCNIIIVTTHVIRICIYKNKNIYTDTHI